jgi:hypothetical protein
MRFLNSLLLFCLLTFLTRCSGQANTAVDDQKKAYEALKALEPAGESPSAAIYLRAVVNGKPWTASKVVRDPTIGSSYYRVTGKSNGMTIGFDVYYRRLKEGDVVGYGSNTAFVIEAEQTYDGGNAGKITITKLDDDGFEGKFYFTATKTADEKGPSKTYVVTDGIFRFPYAKRK